MKALLGNRRKIVKPWYLPGDFVFARVQSWNWWNFGLHTIIVRNKKHIVPNIPDLEIEIIGRNIVGFTSPKLPPIPKIMESDENSPNKVLVPDTDGQIFVTRDFSADLPIWRKYKRMRWALRYLNGKK